MPQQIGSEYKKKLMASNDENGRILAPKFVFSVSITVPYMMGPHNYCGVYIHRGYARLPLRESGGNTFVG